MLGEIEPDLQEAIGVDCLPIFGPRNMFDIDETKLHQQITPWGQEVMIASGIDLTTDQEGAVYIYPKGDRNYPPSAKMPSQCYFINATVRQEFVDDETLKVEDNLEEYGPLSDEDLQFYTGTYRCADCILRALAAASFAFWASRRAFSLAFSFSL